MNKYLKYLVLFLLSVVPGPAILAQINDAGLWLSVNIEKKINPAFSICFTEEMRMYENITEVGQVYSDLGLEYRFAKKFKVSGHYRFIQQKRLDDTYENRHRYYFDLSYKEKIQPVNLVIRLRYLSQNNDLFTSEQGTTPKDHVATKATLKYNPGLKIEPYVSAEAFFRLNYRSQSPFDQMRVTSGIEYVFNRMHSIDVHYSITKEYNVKHPETDYVIGVGYYLVF
jgi:hypothetical protein